ncbi:hypothetical protein ACHAW6_002559 [Cyclotella cf. meneghiniana]
MAHHSLHQSSLDPCLYFGKMVITLCYVDDILFYPPEDKQIDDTIHLLKQDEIMIHKEGSAEGFLGVNVKLFGTPSTPCFLLTQAGLTKHIVEALGLWSSFSSAASTPAETSPLPKDSLGAPATVVGMLLYCCGLTHPDIVFAVHQCAHYTFCPTRHHELALIRVGCYLKGTMDKGLIMSPSDTRQFCRSIW